MNDQPPSDSAIPIPPGEKPREQFDPKLEKLEENTLDKQSRSAAYRDAHERKQHLDSLNKRIEKLQGKLDLREKELQEVLPKLSALEQAMRGVNASLVVGPILMGLGGGVISYAPASKSQVLTAQFLLGSGVVGLIAGGIILLMAFYVKRPVR